MGEGGMILVMVCLVGAVTTPVGIVYYIACAIADTTPSKTARTMFPFIGVYMIILSLIIFFPQLVTFLPNIFFNN